MDSRQTVLGDGGEGKKFHQIASSLVGKSRMASPVQDVHSRIGRVQLDVNV